jgi:hypothetical protein
MGMPGQSTPAAILQADNGFAAVSAVRNGGGCDVLLATVGSGGHVPVGAGVYPPADNFYESVFKRMGVGADNTIP